MASSASHVNLDDAALFGGLRVIATGPVASTDFYSLKVHTQAQAIEFTTIPTGAPSKQFVPITINGSDMAHPFPKGDKLNGLRCDRGW